MNDRALGQAIERSYWLHGTAERIATGLTGIIAVLVALKAAAWTPGTELFVLQHEFVRMAAFASLTIWATFTIGLSRRGAAAMLVMVFAAILELIVMPARAGMLNTLGASAAGITLAYLGLHFYWFQVAGKRAART